MTVEGSQVNPQGKQEQSKLDRIPLVGFCRPMVSSGIQQEVK